VFKGIPYAEPPVAELRFRSPRPMRPWNDVRDALEFGPAAIQTISIPYVAFVYSAPEKTDEDCLTLNVWSPDTHASLPVIVWIHGGGWRTGSSSMPVFDGSHYAEIGNVVFVTINYRLGVLGWAAHPDLRDADTGAFANWAVQDQVAALHWVSDNIAAFGGDPDRITVMGQSGGAINSIMISHEAEPPPFHQIIAMSPPYITPPSSMDASDWGTVVEVLARSLETSVAGLRQVPAMDLHQAELRQFGERTLKANTGRAYRGAAVDGVVLKQWPVNYGLPTLPILIGGIGTEGAARYDLFDPVANKPAAPPAPDDTTITGDVGHFMDALYNLSAAKPSASEVIEHYRWAAQSDGRNQSMAALAKEIFGDASGRYYSVRAAQAAAGTGRSDIYFYDYDLALMPPNHDPAHATELSIFFGTYSHPFYRPKVGDGSLQRSVSRAIVESFCEFAAHGRPASTLLPTWPEFRNSGADVMIFGACERTGQVTSMPKTQQLAILDKLV